MTGFSNLPSSPGDLLNAVVQLVFEAVVVCLTAVKTFGLFEVQRHLQMDEGNILPIFVLRNGV